jgi:hypothetical protein
MTPQPGGGAGAAGRWGGVDLVVSRTMKGDGGNWLWVGGGNPVVSRGAVGRWGDCLWVGDGNPVVSRVPRSTSGYRPAPLAGVRGS